jgi:tyrosyl-tRNA synthetase
VSDTLMFRYFDLLSDLSGEEIQKLRNGMESGEMHPKVIKQQLARELTARFWSAEEAERAEQNFDQVFKKGGLPDDLAEMTMQATDPVWLPQLLVDAGLVTSTSEGRRMIKQNAVSVDGEKVVDMGAMIDPQGEVLLKVGKLRYCRVQFVKP